ncbi:MAG: cation:proton antiporter [Nocardioides sp.]|nr:cation:proton antiporter [Nocardioides sp.]
MNDVIPFAAAVVVAGIALLLAVGSSRLTAWTQIPSPALFLIAASIAADVFPDLGSLGIRADQRVVTVALVVILFDGGLHIGLSRFRPVAGPVVWLGVAGTFVTAAGLALASHYWFGFDWRAALLLGTALAPTDPATVFSVLGRREVTGRTGTLLEGEAGANDPVGIALMVSILAATGGGFGAVAHVTVEFLLQLGLGVVFGLVGGYALRWLLRHLPMPNEALYPLRALAFALVLYGVTTICHGSGFLAVLLAGIMAGDTRAPYKREIEHFASGLASLAEIVAFTILGLSIPISSAFSHGRAATAIGLAVVLVLLVRPLLVGLVLVPVRLRPGERAFVLWAGLKGVVPILLGTYVVAEGEPEAERLYAVIFVVVLLSVVVQGGLVPTFARLWRVPMRVVEPEPWAMGMRFRDRPEGLHRYVVQRGSTAAGSTIRDLPLDEDVWVSVVSRGGRMVQVTGSTTLEVGDEVLAITSDDSLAADLFRSRG